MFNQTETIVKSEIKYLFFAVFVLLPILVISLPLYASAYLLSYAINWSRTKLEQYKPLQK